MAMKHIILDSEPLGLITHPANKPDVVAIKAWAASLLSAGHYIYIPEVIDYELRRELLRLGKSDSLALLDALPVYLRYLPLNTDTMRLAADLWAWARQAGLPTGDPKRLDIDVILAAQALTVATLVAGEGDELIIATSNVAHIARFANTDLWTNIRP